jgi:DNA helicase-2/ATP-dependent DNA helicase PcrA
MDKLLEGLNQEQKRAVRFGGGPLLIIAGAGTGKTKVITHRIAYLIANKLARPEEILAVTFTEKAANEMEERVDLLIPYSYSFVEISTFNSFGERVLRDYAHELGYNLDFKLLDDVEQAIFFRENLFRFPLKFYRPLSVPTRHIQELLKALRRLKQEDVKPESYLAYAREARDKAVDEAALEAARKHQELALVYKTYQKLLRRRGLIDFEDQVNLTVELFRARPSILKEHQQKYKYILVDEFQDTNYIQFELLKLLAGSHHNITVVGDDDQSIFRFRGASLSNILNFSRIYPQAERVVINKNYRSTQPILDAAYTLIQHNNPHRLEVKEEIDKSLKSMVKSRSKSIHRLQFDTLSHEADHVAEIIRTKLQEGHVLRDFAILVRRNADADPFLRALNMREIPFRFSGSRGLYAQKEIKVLVSFLRALTNFEDSRSLFYLALSEIYALSPYDLTVMANHAHKKNLSLHAVFQSISRDLEPVKISLKSREVVKRLFKDLLYFVTLAAERNAGEVLYTFLERTGYLKSLVGEKSLGAELRIKNVRLFFNKVKAFSDISEDDSTHAFAQHLDLLQQVGDNPASAEAELEEAAVNVLTVHKAKGLEFPTVFLVSLISDRYPGREQKERIALPDEVLKEQLLLDSDAVPEEWGAVQEERRLFYVGMTRAKTELYLTWAQDYGLKRLKKVSPFVLEALDLPRIPEETLRTSALEDIKRYSPEVIQTEIPAVPKKAGFLSLSFIQVDDYITCPLKYMYRHLYRIPVLPHYNLVYGRVLHDTIHFYLKGRLSGQALTEKQFIKEYHRRWINEGFLSREHEEMKKEAGEKALRMFFSREESADSGTMFLEKQFKWQEGGLRFIGRWDRVDECPEGPVIVDFKATQVKDQDEADKKVRSSLQMDVYALSFLRSQNRPVFETRLHYLESDIVGCARKGEKELTRAREKIALAESGINARDFAGKPNWHNCSHCDFRSICPSSYAK